ncbi:MAG: hypothetical protein IKO52_13940 [Clostridia bacterium]|nr:hypothetical protein [Clostridia bacterium]
MNFQGKAVLVYLEEDNIARAYFRVQPLMTQDGPIGPVAAEYPDDGFLRIVPDKNEQHTFKERMRTLIGLCLVDLRFFPMDANKIRTNKNYSPSRGENNQFIVYSDAVRSLPEDLLYQVVGENDVKNASTPQVYIRRGANIQGPFRREDGQSVGETAQLPPDSGEIHSLTVNGQEQLFYWPRKIERAESPKPEAQEAEPQPAPVPAPAPVPVPVVPAATQAEPPAPAPAAAQVNAYEQIQSLNGQLSENANRLNASAPAAMPEDFMPEQQTKALVGTRLYQTPQRQVNPRRAHNPLMEVVENQRYAARYESRYEAPGATIPQNTELKEVHNPADALKRALQGMSHSPETQRQAADVILSQSGMRITLSKALAHETNDLTLAAMQSQLQELEAERLMTLMQLDDAKKNLAAAHEEALGKLNMAEQKKLDQLHIAQQTAKNELDKLNKVMEPLEKKRQEIAKAIQEGQEIGDNSYLCAPEGRDASKEELIERMEKTFKAAGFVMEEGDALTLLTALALTDDVFEFRSETKADAQTALSVLAHALGAPLKDSRWMDSLVMLPGGSAPVLVQNNDANYPLVWKVDINSLSDWDEPQGWRLPYASVPVAVNQDALPVALPEYAPVTKDCILKAFQTDAALNDETKAAVSALRKGLKEADAPLPVAAVSMICRFISATQNELKGGVAEAIDRAACLYIVPHLLDRKVDLDGVKSLFAAMPRTLKALKA